jgi:hypothetical protein
MPGKDLQNCREVNKKMIIFNLFKNILTEKNSTSNLLRKIIDNKACLKKELLN